MANPATGSIAPGKDKKIKLKADVKEKVNLNFKLTVMLGTEAHFLNVRVRSVTGVFGTDPTTLDHVEDDGLRVPEVLVLMKKSLIAADGLRSEGIFRLAGDVFEIARLKEEMNKKIFEKSDEVNTVATLIKVWFRELPEPILNKVPTESIFYSSDSDRCINAYRELAEPYKTYLTWLLDLLCKTTAHSQVNRMTPQNLAIVVAPNLYDTSSSDPMEGLVMSQKCVQFLNNILLWYLEEKTGSVPQQTVSPSIPINKDPNESNSAGSLIITPRGTSKSPSKQRRGLQRNATEGPVSSSSLSRSNETLDGKSPSNSPRTGVRRNKSIRETGAPGSPRSVTPRNRPSHPAPPIPSSSSPDILHQDQVDGNANPQTASELELPLGTTSADVPAGSTPNTPHSPSTAVSNSESAEGVPRMPSLLPPTPQQQRAHLTNSGASNASGFIPAQIPSSDLQQKPVSSLITLDVDGFEHTSSEPIASLESTPTAAFPVESSSFNSAEVEAPSIPTYLTSVAPVAPVAGTPSLSGTPPPTMAPPGTPPAAFGRPPAISVSSPRLIHLTPRDDSSSARSLDPATPTSTDELSPFTYESTNHAMDATELPRTPRQPSYDNSAPQGEEQGSPRLIDDNFEEDVVEAEADVTHARAALQGLPTSHSFLPPPSPGMTH